MPISLQKLSVIAIRKNLKIGPLKYTLKSLHYAAALKNKISLHTECTKICKIADNVCTELVPDSAYYIYKERNDVTQIWMDSIELQPIMNYFVYHKNVLSLQTFMQDFDYTDWY